jgi:hypothetical protein
MPIDPDVRAAEIIAELFANPDLARRVGDAILDLRIALPWTNLDPGLNERRSVVPGRKAFGSAERAHDWESWAWFVEVRPRVRGVAGSRQEARGAVDTILRERGFKLMEGP